MTYIFYQRVLSLLSYERLSRKPLLFKSFTGLTVQLYKSFTGLTVHEFDDIYDNKMAKKYTKHELKRLSKRLNRKRKIGAG